MLTAEQIKELEAPLSRAHVKGRKQGGRQVSYIEGWVAIAEANRIFGFDGWDRETVTLIETNRESVELTADDGARYRQWRVGYLAKVRVRVGETVREGTGFGSGMARPELLGDAIESAIKEAETDAMKRALMTFGNPFGLALYDKTQANVEDVPARSSSYDQTWPPEAQEAPRATPATDQYERDRRLPKTAPNGITRLSSAQATRKGLDKQIADAIWGCTTHEELSAWQKDFDKHTAEAPVAWLDPIRNDIILRAEAITKENGDLTDAKLDAEFKAVMA